MYVDDLLDPAHAAAAAAHVSSRYNFHVPTKDGVLLYNSCSGAVIRLSGEAGDKLAKALSTQFITVAEGELPESVWKSLKQGGFIVPSGFNELEVIRDRFLKARQNAPVFLTLTTTQDCNLGCYYCYEERTKDHLGAMDIEAIGEWIRNKFADRSDRLLHVDWYGGEPLLNIDFIEAASPAIQRVCAENNLRYTSSIISNGTLWPDDIGSFVKRHKIQQAQISFDGLRENHNQRRRYRPGFKEGATSSSFDLAVGVVDELLSHCRVDVRLNLDRGSYDDLCPFMDFARERGWFEREYPCVLMPARLSYYTARSEFMRKIELDHEQMDEIRAVMRQASTERRVVIDEAEEHPDAFAYPRNSVCSALAHSSQVIGADGSVYQCGLQVGEKHRAVGKLESKESKPDEAFPAADWWRQYDPTTFPNCSRCSFLPVCWGGCPLKHLDQDAHGLEEQSIFWRVHLPRLITARFGETPPEGYAFTETDQFR